MRKVTLIQITFSLFILWIVLSTSQVIPDGYRTFAFLGLVLIFAVLMDNNYFSEQPLGYAHWINPILDVMVVFIKLDGNTGILESKRVKKYLDNEFDPYTAGLKYNYFKLQLSKRINLKEKLTLLRETTSSMERMRIVNELVKIALVDRLMSDNELKFITLVAKRLGLHQRTLNSILQIHTYITEEDIKNQQNYKPRMNQSLQKAYSILGLDSNATEKEVKDAYRELAKLYHPDKQRGSKKGKELAKTQFQVIAQAYELIKNNVK